jgi:hypothetical protein
MVSMMDILSGASPLIADVRQTGSGPTYGSADGHCAQTLPTHGALIDDRGGDELQEGSESC